MIQQDPMEEYTNITKINEILFLVGKVRGTQKQGKFYYFFLPQRALRFAGVYENDLKIGLWVDLIENYEVISCGQYANGLKNGIWGIFSKEGMIGGGQYINGKKTGPWIDVEKKSFQWIMNQGQYENGIRKGEWRIYSISQILYRYCGGKYNENGQKEGLAVFNGVRSTAFMMVVFGHSALLIIQVTYQLELLSAMSQWKVLFIINMLYSADIFFWLGGFSMAFVMCEKKRAQALGKNPVSVFIVILHRLLRIWPCYILCMMINSYLIPFAGEGPRWWLELINRTVDKFAIKM